MHHYIDHIVATLIIFILLILLERVIHRNEPEHTTVELFLAAVGNAISIPLTISAIVVTYIVLAIFKQPNAISRASYWPVELLRLITRRKSRRRVI